MNIANFTAELKQVHVLNIWQWDYGQTLRIQGLNLPPAIEIHFSLQESDGEAVRRIAISKDGVTDVPIPDSMLEKDTSTDYKIFVFIYPSGRETGETTHKIVLHIKARPRPEAFEDPNTEDLFHKTIEQVNTAMESASNSAQSAKESAETSTQNAIVAEEARKSVLEMQADINLNAQAVEISEKNILEAERRVKQSEDNVNIAEEGVRINKEAVDQAKSYVDASKKEVKEAEENVLSCTNRAEQAATDAQADSEEAEGFASIAELSANAASISEQNAKDAEALVKQHKTDAELAAKTAQDVQADVTNKKEQIDASEKNVNQKAQEMSKQAENFTNDREQIGINAESIANNRKLIEDLAIKNSASGNPVLLKDSAKYKPIDLQIKGSTTQGENPSPENPQEVVLGEWDRISATGKNLFDGKWTEGITLDYLTGEEVLSSKSIAFTNYVEINSKTLYGLSFNAKNKKMRFYDKNKEYIQTPKIAWGRQEKLSCIIEDHNIKYLRISIDLGGEDMPYKLILSCEPISEYEPYKGFTETFPKIQLSEWDKIKKVDGVWKKENGTEHILKYNGEEITTEFKSTTGELSIGAEIYYKKSELTYEELPQETQDILNKIELYYPNSVISTNDGITLDLQYVADPKIYIANSHENILKRLDALEKATVEK